MSPALGRKSAVALRYHSQSLEDSLLVYIIDNENTFQKELLDLDGNLSLAVLDSIPGQFNSYFYRVDVTSYIDEIQTSDTDLDYSLMIQFNDFNINTESTVIEAGDNEEKVKLSVKYLNY